MHPWSISKTAPPIRLQPGCCCCFTRIQEPEIRTPDLEQGGEAERRGLQNNAYKGPSAEEVHVPPEGVRIPLSRSLAVVRSSLMLRMSAPPATTKARQCLGFRRADAALGVLDNG